MWPNSPKRFRNAARVFMVRGSCSLPGQSIPTRRIWPCASTAVGQDGAVAEMPTSVMNSRRCIRPPRRRLCRRNLSLSLCRSATSDKLRATIRTNVGQTRTSAGRFDMSGLQPIETNSGHRWRSGSCQSRHLAPQQNKPLLDHLVGAGEQRRYRAAFLNHALATS